MCSRHVIRAGAQAKSNNRQASGGSVVQSVWRRSCVYVAYAGGDCLRRLLMTCGRLCQRCAVACLSMQISILGDDHSIMRQTHGTHTLTNTLDTVAHLQRNLRLSTTIRCLLSGARWNSFALCSTLQAFCNAARGCSAHLPPSPWSPRLGHAMHNGRGKWFGNTHFNLRFVCLSALSCPLWACPTSRTSKARKEGEAKVERLVVRQSLKPHGKLAKEFYAANRCSNCAHLTLVRVCVLFLVESLIKFLINEISGMRMSVWARHSWIPFLNILFMLLDTTINCGKSRSRCCPLRSVSSNVAPRICQRHVNYIMTE